MRSTILRGPCVPCSLASASIHRSFANRPSASCGVTPFRSCRIQSCLSIPRSHLQDEELAAPDVGWLWDSKAAATRAKLAAIAAKPKKALGQNFVTDDNILARIVRESGIGAGDYVLEVGPGTGNLTRHLIQAGATVLAVEKDYVLAEKLSEVYQEIPYFQCIQGDVLRVDVPSLTKQLRRLPSAVSETALQGDVGSREQSAPAETAGGSTSSASGTAENERIASASTASTSTAPTGQPGRIKVVANLPYYITTELLKVLFPMGDDISVLAFMLQDEVAQRLVSLKPDGTQYRAMTVMAHYFSTPRYRLKIDRRHYFPAPKVHGALATFELRPPSERPLLPHERRFLAFVRKAFGSKRKKLSNSLQPLWSRDEVLSALESLGLDPQLRPQDLPSDQFVTLFMALSAQQAPSVEAAAQEADEVEVGAA